MFQPPMFREERIDVMQRLMKAHSFATLVSCVEGHLSANHLPLVVHPELSDNGIIRGHVAVANPLFKAGKALEKIEVMAVFQGPQAYVSPAWYPSKQEHGKVVPTWNYAVVHAHGSLRFVQETEWLMAHLAELTLRNEGHRNVPWVIDDAPADFIQRQLKGLVGIEIDVSSLVGQWKFSQNKNPQDKNGVELGLLADNTEQTRAVSDLVRG